MSVHPFPADLFPADLFPADAAREQIASLVERRATEAHLEIAILGTRARRSIAQRTRRHLERMAERMRATS